MTASTHPGPGRGGRARRGAAAAACLALAPLAAIVPAGSPAAGASGVDPGPAATVWAPRTSVAEIYGDRKFARVQLDARLVAGAAPLELWSTRASYDEQIRTVWRSPAGDVELPLGSMTTFNALDDFVRVQVTDLRTGKKSRSKLRDTCLNGWGVRVRPDAPARSPYPTYCFANPYSLGSVQGVQAGWSTPLLEGGRSLRLPRGRYDVTVRLARPYAAALGLPAAATEATTRVLVRRDRDGDGEPGHEGPHPAPAGGGRHDAGTARPAAAPPRGPELTDVDGPRPNLRSLPAWGISMARNGNYLRFAATVWNAGDSPLVVDGFRREGEDLMDAYQYFFDGDGEQVGYQQVGSFEFDRKPSHQHWHFRDFATYTLLRADRTTAVVSKKESFCLANTDSIDQTVPGADWNPENTNLSTDCGSPDSLSLREVLSAGWGDTYAQFRAGQSFSLKGLPNGTYYIATIANPEHRLVESNLDDNVALRRVRISGQEGDRKVRVPQVGIIEEPEDQW